MSAAVTQFFHSITIAVNQPVLSTSSQAETRSVHDPPQTRSTKPNLQQQPNLSCFMLKKRDDLCIEHNTDQTLLLYLKF